MAMEKFKPHLLMILVQICYTFLYFITEASFSHGMNPHVYVTYRNIVGGLVILPFAYVLERKKRPKLTMALLLEFFVLSLMGVSFLNMYFVSLTFTSPTFIASMLNTIAALTFVLAVILRLEIVNVEDPRGIAKIIGTLVSLAGVMIMTLYKGAILKNLWHPIIYIHQGNNVVKEDWVKGSILTIASCITRAIWYIMQVGSTRVRLCPVLGRDRLTFFELEDNLRVQLNQVGLHTEKISSTIVTDNMEQKGPVFVTMFNPLSTILVALLAYFVFGEKLYMGSIIGAIIVIVGLYLLLWGKEDPKSERKDEEKCCTIKKELHHEDNMMQKFTSDANPMDTKKPKQ
uniref:WAT1-related protein n=1 Tax=Solanum tuberosum TaxID=4113 RepID=M1CNG4_SOLTU